MAAPKSSLDAAQTFAADQNQVTALTLHGGYVYWTTSYALGTVARCPVMGCGGGQPEVLADGQSYPYFVQVDGEFVSWMNGAKGPEKGMNRERAVQILSCQLPGCPENRQVLDAGMGGGFAARRNLRAAGVDTGLSAGELVIDETAIYWFGDVSYPATFNPRDETVKTSIRRTERPVKAFLP